MKTKTIELSKVKRFAVNVARFAINNGIDAYDVAELVTLAERAFKAGERYCNSDSERVSKANDAAQERFEKRARELGFVPSWSGLWPSLTKDGSPVYLPCEE